MPDDGLDVVPVLMGDDIGDGEVAALRAEAALQLIEEAEVEIDLLVGRAVERARRRRRRPTAGRGAALEQDEVLHRALLAVRLERLLPEDLDVLGRPGQELVGVVLRVERAARLRRAAGWSPDRPPRPPLPPPSTPLNSRNGDDDEDDQPADAAAGLASRGWIGNRRRRRSARIRSPPPPP